MGGRFAPHETKGFIRSRTKGSCISSHVPGEMPRRYEPYDASESPFSPVDAGARSSLKSRHKSRAETYIRSCATEQPGPRTPAPYGQVHIFCPDEASRLRSIGKPQDSGKRLSSSGRATRNRSPRPLPSRFELAAVAALRSPKPGTFLSTYRRRPQRMFPSPLSCVPGGQLPPPVSTPSLPALCNAPLSTIRKSKEAITKTGLHHVFTPRRGSPVRTKALPFPAVVTPNAQEATNQPLQQAAALPQPTLFEKTPLRCHNPLLRQNAGWSRPTRFEQTRLIGTTHLIDPVLPSPEMSEQASLENASPGWGASKTYPRSFALWRWHDPCSEPTRLHGEASHALESYKRCIPSCNGISNWPSDTRTLKQLPNPTIGYAGIKASDLGSETNSLFVPQSSSHLSSGISPVVKQRASITQGQTGGNQCAVADAPEEVVTVNGTERFWELMDTLVELQRGPTSLLSSSVTFDSIMLPGGELQYLLIEQGSFGKVFVGTHQGMKVAIKVPVESMLRNDAAGVMERTVNEWQILSMCQHPNVVQLVGGIVHGPFDVWLVTQLAKGNDLHSRKYSRDPRVQRCITPENGLYMCRQLAAVVAYLHSPIPGRKPVVVHRDIKPENVLIADDWSIQLCDFGDAEASADGRVSRILGATWFYAPAELLRCSPVECMTSDPGIPLPLFNEKWDIWSMGCVFQEMFGFFNPMHVHISNRDSPNIIYQKLKSKAIAGELFPDIAKEIQGIARSIISKCLNPDPEARPTAAEVLQMWSANDEDILKDLHQTYHAPQESLFLDNLYYVPSQLQRCSASPAPAPAGCTHSVVD